MAKQKTTTQTLDDFPAYCEARQKLGDLQLQRDDLRRELDDARSQHGSGDRAGINQAATALLEGTTQVGEANSIAQLERDFAVAKRAVELQQRVVEDELRVASTAIVEDHLPARRQLIADVLAAITSLGKAYQKMAAQDDELSRAGGGHLPVPQLQVVPPLQQAVALLRSPAGETLLRKIHRDNS